MYHYSKINGSIFFIAYFSILLGLPLFLQRWFNGQGAKIGQEKDKLTKTFFDFYHGQTDYLLANREKAKEKEILGHFKRSSKLHKKSDNIEVYANRAILLFSHIILLVTLYFNIEIVKSGRLDSVYYPMLALLTLSSFEGLAGLPQAGKALDDSLSASRELVCFTDYTPLKEVTSDYQFTNYDIVLDKVSFSYDKMTSFIDSLAFQIKTGEKVAFVGLSGSGKSTLAKMIAGLWQPLSGSLTLGGVSYSDISKNTLWKTIGMLEQKPYIFDTTIRENLLLARKDASEADLWEALSKVSLKEKVKSLKKGLDEILKEEGSAFSGGERERLALARLYIKKPDILILDEPYHGLDEKVKKEVMTNLFHFAKDKTTIMITHEFSGLEQFDCIYVFENGKVIESGNHSSLIAQNGVYKGFYELEKRRI